MSKLLVAISGYDGDRHQIENNWSCYRHHNHPVLILSPEDAPISKFKESESISIGKKGWAGPHTLLRQELFLRELFKKRADYYLFHDADSVCLEPNLPEYLFRSPDIFWSNEVLDPNKMPSRLPRIALQPPYFFSFGVLKKLILGAVDPAISFGKPVDAIDHWLLQIVYSGEVNHKSFPDGASFETTSEPGLNTMSEHVRAYGKIFIHQVKTKSVLDRLLADRRIFLKHKL